MSAPVADSNGFRVGLVLPFHGAGFPGSDLKSDRELLSVIRRSKEHTPYSGQQIKIEREMPLLTSKDLLGSAGPVEHLLSIDTIAFQQQSRQFFQSKPFRIVSNASPSINN